MKDFRLSRGLCAAVGDALTGSHSTLDALFISSGAPGEPPDLAHHSKWKEWLFRAGQDPEVDSLKVLGNVLEEFMDLSPDPDNLENHDHWIKNKQRVEEALKIHHLQYFPGGRIIPTKLSADTHQDNLGATAPSIRIAPHSIEELLNVTVNGLPRAMHPLAQRRKGLTALRFDNEYDVQDLLHSLLRPWVADIRPEEFTPSYAGKSTRMDFLLPQHQLVVETKIVRDNAHAKNIGDELIIDISHYKNHPDCKTLLCVVYDPQHAIQNVGGLKKDLSGEHSDSNGSVNVKVIVV